MTKAPKLIEAKIFSEFLSLLIFRFYFFGLGAILSSDQGLLLDPSWWRSVCSIWDEKRLDAYKESSLPTVLISTVLTALLREIVLTWLMWKITLNITSPSENIFLVQVTHWVSFSHESAFLSFHSSDFYLLVQQWSPM